MQKTNEKQTDKKEKKVNVMPIKDVLQEVRFERKLAEAMAKNKEIEFKKLKRRMSYDNCLANKEKLTNYNHQMVQLFRNNNKSIMTFSRMQKDKDLQKKKNQNQSLRNSIKEGKIKRENELKSKLKQQKQLNKMEKDYYEEIKKSMQAKEREKHENMVCFIRASRTSSADNLLRNEANKKALRKQYMKEQISEELSLKDQAMKRSNLYEKESLDYSKHH